MMKEASRASESGSLNDTNDLLLNVICNRAGEMKMMIGVKNPSDSYDSVKSGACDSVRRENMI